MFVCNAIVAVQKPLDDDFLPPLVATGALAHLRRHFQCSQFVSNRIRLVCLTGGTARRTEEQTFLSATRSPVTVAPYSR